MSQVELTQLRWAGKNLKQVGTVIVQSDDIVARLESKHHSVLYLGSGEKILVQESLDEIDRLTAVPQTQRELLKRFKRDIRECKAMGMSVDQAFAALWEEISTRAKLSEEEQGALYQELLEWTKRWLK